MIYRFTRSCLLALPLVIACSTSERAGWVDAERLAEADQEPGQWMALGRTFHGQRFSPLTRISTDNVSRLGFAWEYTARSGRGRVEHGQEATPIMVDGVIYVAGPWGSAFAVDARTGQQRWRYDPEVDGSYARRACCDVVNRGLQVWKGRVYVATLDGFLVSLDAATGREIWRADTFIDRDSRFYTITGPPQVAKNVVVIGNSGAEFGVRGYVTAYDLETGAEKWRFFTVPGDPAKGPPENAAMALAARTWGPDTDWESGLGGTVWGEMTYDPELDLLYVGTGNSTPYSGWNRDPSKGDNLFLVSILAIDPDDGRLAWHYQQVPWELWDYTATANMILADLTIDGQVRQVIMQAPKNGYYYVLDRATGEFLSARPFVFTNWALSIDSAGRPVINPAAIYREKPAVVFPTQAGAHNWQPMAFSPATGLAYIPAREQGMVMFDAPGYKWQKGSGNSGAGGLFGFVLDMVGPAERAFFEGIMKATPGIPSPVTREILIAWDPVTQQERWRVPTGNEEFAGGGVLVTAGNLVIHGNSAGHLLGYDATTGTPVLDIDVGTGIMAAPISYELDGEQYIAVLAGFGGALARIYPRESAPYRHPNYGRLLAFKLGGGPTPLPAARVPGTTPEPPVIAEDSDSLAALGSIQFLSHCMTCHGARGEARLSAYPDLHRLSAETYAAFDSIVRGGKLASLGMSGFQDLLTETDVRAIRVYLAREQRKLRAEEQR